MGEQKFEIGQRVLYQNYNQDGKWVLAIITGVGIKNGRAVYDCRLDKPVPSWHSGKQWGYKDQFKASQ